MSSLTELHRCRLTSLSASCLGWRRHRSRRYNRKFLGGPRETIPTLPVFEPAVLDTEQPEPKRNFVQRIIQGSFKTRRTELKPKSEDHSNESLEATPVLDRKPTRRLSARMESIPEAQSPRPSVERRLSEHPTEIINTKEKNPGSFVHPSEHPSSPSSSSDTVGEPPNPLEPNPVPNITQQSTSDPERRMTSNEP